MELHEQIRTKERQECIGTHLEVLVEQRGKDGKFKGRTRCWKNVVFDGPDVVIGTLQNIKIHSYNFQTLMGELIIHPLLMKN